MHNGSNRLLIAKYVPLPRKCSEEKPVIHTRNRDRKKKKIMNANTDRFLKIPVIVMKVSGGLLINLIKATIKVKIPNIKNAMIAIRLEEYPKRKAVF
jgi:hypothetical protein